MHYANYIIRGYTLCYASYIRRHHETCVSETTKIKKTRKKREFTGMGALKRVLRQHHQINDNPRNLIVARPFPARNKGNDVIKLKGSSKEAREMLSRICPACSPLVYIRLISFRSSGPQSAIKNGRRQCRINANMVKFDRFVCVSPNCK